MEREIQNSKINLENISKEVFFFPKCGRTL